MKIIATAKYKKEGQFTPEEKKRMDDPKRPNGTRCPNCNMFNGGRDVCPYCGAPQSYNY